MAISAEAQARAFNQALGMVAQERAAERARGRAPPGVGVSAIARRLYDNNRTVTGANYSSYAAVARRAAQAVLLAETMAGSPEYAATRAATPEVATLYPGADRYRYHVVVVHEDAGGRERRVRGEVTSQVPLSAREIEERVADRVDYYDSPVRANRSNAIRLPAGAEILRVEILAATRTW